MDFNFMSVVIAKILMQNKANQMLGIDPLFGSFHRKCIVNVPILELSVLPKLQIISNHRCFSFDENYPNRRNYNLVTLKKHTTN